MPKSRKRKGRHTRKGPHFGGPFLPNLDAIKALAQELDTPEMREIYRSQKMVNPNLDKEVEELTEEIEEILNHDNDSKE